MAVEAILIVLIIGAVAGWLAGLIVKGMGFGLIGNIVVGIVGAFIAGWLLPRIGIVDRWRLGCRDHQRHDRRRHPPGDRRVDQARVDARYLISLAPQVVPLASDGVNVISISAVVPHRS